MRKNKRGAGGGGGGGTLPSLRNLIIQSHTHVRSSFVILGIFLALEMPVNLCPFCRHFDTFASVLSSSPSLVSEVRLDESPHSEVLASSDKAYSSTMIRFFAAGEAWEAFLEMTGVAGMGHSTCPFTVKGAGSPIAGQI